MAFVHSYRDLDVWRCAVDLAVNVTLMANRLPANELFALGLQLRRAAVSVSSNIAEGYGRSTRPEYIRFLRIARGSAAEVSSLLTITERLQYVSSEDIGVSKALCERVSAMLTRLLQTLEGRRDD